jgi:GTP cyclohydrolase I
MTALLKSVPVHDGVQERIAAHVRAIIEELGEDLGRDGLAATPVRYANALRYLTAGYGGELEAAVGNGIFPAEGESPVLMRDVRFYSLCEHHLLPFHGRVHIGYLPSRRIIGLSKIPRIVDLFARRFQVQERLTEQVADALVQTLEPKGVVVLSEAQHLCMAMPRRAARPTGSWRCCSAAERRLYSSAATNDVRLSGITVY